MGLSDVVDEQDSICETPGVSLCDLNRENGDLDEQIEDISVGPQTVSMSVDGAYYETDCKGRKRRGIHLEVSIVVGNLGHFLHSLIRPFIRND